MFTKIVKDEFYRGYRVLVKQIGEKTSGELYIKLLNDYPKITKRSASLRVSFK